MKTLPHLLSLLLLFALPLSSAAHYSVEEQAPKKPQAKSVVRIAVLLDTSNSMDGLIEQAKTQLWDLVNELIDVRYADDKPGLEIALYEYGNDGLNAREGYIRQVTPLTDDLDQVSEDLFGLTTNGGSEFCGQVIQTSLNQLNWDTNKESLQFIFIAGNEPFTQGPIHYATACGMAKDKNVVVNTIYCGNYNQGVTEGWKAGAVMTNGQYMSIDSDKATVFVPSPYDERIDKLNNKLNDTYIGYGSLGHHKKEQQMMQDRNAAEYSQANAVSRAASKSSRFYKNSSWDLVDAVEEEVVAIEDLDEDDLPEELKGKSEEEIAAYVEEKSAERKAISEEIQELTKQREAYVAKKRAEMGDDSRLDAAMLKAIREQAAVKEFYFVD